jgi:hypothetical protein|tara:strand:+ start:1472 stop:3118 length:1647 start_codon:yes stop_codon:yes gene_type:complete
MAQWRKVIVSGSTATLHHVTASGDIVPAIADGGSLGTSTFEWSDAYLADGGVLNFGADQDTTVTHIADEALRINSSRGLQFRDAALNISSSADGQLDINADAKMVITTPQLSASNDVWVGGNIHAVGDINFQAGSSGTITLGDTAGDSVSFGADVTSNIIPNASDSYNLGSTGQRWNDLWISGSITANGGAHSLTSATTIDIDADGALTIDGGSVTIGGDADVAFDIDTSTLDIDSSGAITIDSTAGVSIDAGAASNLSTSAGALTLHGAGGIDIGKAADVAIDIDSSTLDIDASGAVTIDTSAGGVSVDAAAASNFTTAAGALTLDGAGGVNIAGNAAEIDITTSAALDLNSGAFTLNGSSVGIDGSGALTMGAASMDIDADGGAIDIDATTTITIGGTNSTGVTIGKSDTTVTVPGSMDINGTLTTIDTTNLRVADRFIQLASGSVAGDGGIIVTTAANGSGSAMFWDDSALRWGLTGDGETGDTQLSVPTPKQYSVTISQSAAAPSGNPSDFGADAATRRGMMYIQTADDATHGGSVAGDVWIWS